MHPRAQRVHWYRYDKAASAASCEHANSNADNVAHSPQIVYCFAATELRRRRSDLRSEARSSHPAARRALQSAAS
jgi:hypothetical protein